jgi:hypothetical protein
VGGDWRIVRQKCKVHSGRQARWLGRNSERCEAAVDISGGAVVAGSWKGGCRQDFGLRTFCSL